MATKNTTSTLAQTPFLKIILPAALGIVAAHTISPHPVVSAVCCAAALFAAVVFRNHATSGIYTWCAIALFFMSVSAIRMPHGTIPTGGRIVMAAQIAENPYTQGRWRMTTADVGYYRADTHGAEWHKTGERIRLAVDTSYNICAGEQLAFRAWLNPIDTTDSGYGKLMNRRGLHSKAYITRGNLIRKSPHVSKTPTYYASQLQNAAIARLHRLELGREERGVVTAMTAGDKRYIPRTVRSDYSGAGTAHLLAVSGLHVGIVFSLINLVLWFLPFFRRGHIAKNIIAVIAIWGYATMAGLSPSVIRAALMFSFAQFALASSSYYNALNIILGSAVVMLALNPNYAGDPSFMLSYSAVLFIFLLFKPLRSLIQTRYKPLNAILSVMAVGLAASIGTAPLVSYWFGHIPIAGLIINPIAILTAHTIVLGGVLWIVMPLELLKPLFSTLLDTTAQWQNDITAWGASRSWAGIAVTLPLWAVIAIYALVITVAIIIRRRYNGKTEKIIG
jgi:competence protein ComEC